MTADLHYITKNSDFFNNIEWLTVSTVPTITVEVTQKALVAPWPTLLDYRRLLNCIHKRLD